MHICINVNVQNLYLKWIYTPLKLKSPDNAQTTVIFMFHSLLCLLQETLKSQSSFFQDDHNVIPSQPSQKPAGWIDSVWILSPVSGGCGQHGDEFGQCGHSLWKTCPTQMFPTSLVPVKYPHGSITPQQVGRCKSAHLHVRCCYRRTWVVREIVNCWLMIWSTLELETKFFPVWGFVKTCSDITASLCLPVADMWSCFVYQTVFCRCASVSDSSTDVVCFVLVFVSFCSDCVGQNKAR